MISPKPFNVAAVILAAGESSRMGCPKQLLTHDGKSLLSRSIESAHHAGCTDVIVVLGAKAEAILGSLGVAAEAGEVEGHLTTGSFLFTINPAWEHGLSSSIIRGIQLVQKTDADASLLMLCDQPFITPDDLKNLIAACQSSQFGIAAASYQGTLGAPACFSRSHFHHLQQLRGKRGAKHLLEMFSTDISIIDIEHAAIDIDTPADYARILQSNCHSSDITLN